MSPDHPGGTATAPDVAWPEQSATAWAKDQARRQLAPRFIAQKVEIIKRVGAALGLHSAQAIHPAAVMDWLTKEGELGVTPKTLNNILSVLNSWGRWLAEREEVQRNPFEAIRPSRTFGADSYRALSLDEVTRLITVADQDERAETPRFTVKRGLIYRTAYGTGLRRGELMQLRVEDVDLAASPPRIRIRPKVAKARKAQWAMVPPWLIGPLNDATRGRERRDLLFSPFPHPRVFDGDFADAGLGAVGGQRATFHSLRKSYVTMLAVSGTDQPLIQKLARHSDPRMTDAVYTDRRLLPLGQAVMALPEPTAGEKTLAGEKSRQNVVAKQQEADRVQHLQSAEPAAMQTAHDHLEARPALAARTEDSPSICGGRASSGRGRATAISRVSPQVGATGLEPVAAGLATGSGGASRLSPDEKADLLRAITRLLVVLVGSAVMGMAAGYITVRLTSEPTPVEIVGEGGGRP